MLLFTKNTGEARFCRLDVVLLAYFILPRLFNRLPMGTSRSGAVNFEAEPACAAHVQYRVIADWTLGIVDWTLGIVDWTLGILHIM